MRPFILVIVALLGTSVAAVATTTEGEAQASAELWLGLVDNQKYEQSWTEAGAVFQSGIPQQGWTERVKKLRDSLGAETERKLLKITLTKTLPGVPDGDYAVVQFTTAFAKKAAAVETVTLGADGAKLKTIGYFIR